jgi:DHA1 family tetracycline resistance protein-like MFS transporter
MILPNIEIEHFTAQHYSQKEIVSMKSSNENNPTRHPEKGQGSTKERNLWIITAITVLNGIGMTIVFPVFPFLVGNYLPEWQIAIGLNALVSVYAFCEFFSAPVFGALSDRFGRKPILIISLFGSALGFLVLGIGGALWVLFLGRIVDGLTAGNISTLFAYVADSTEPEERTKWYGYIGGAIGIGTMIGPAIGGLLGTRSIPLPFYVTAGITFLSILCVYFFLPESLAPERQTQHFSTKSLNTFVHIQDIFSVKEAAALLVLGAFFYIGLSIYQFNASIFLKDVFAWGPVFIGGILTLVGVCDIAARVFLLPQLLKKFSERSLGIAGLCGMAIGLALLFASSFNASAALFITGVIFIALGEGLFDPSYNSRLSQSVSEDKQGQLQGANQSLQAAYHVIVPLVSAAIYIVSHSALFAIAALLLAWALVLFIKLRAPAADVAGSTRLETSLSEKA